ncbi:MAG: SPASM domain-containing protein [Candidatus Berkelbacteria bacterium]|nr:SPASM domain-containing protein [Candidatus Berkelbacteria bacterium]
MQKKITVMILPVGPRCNLRCAYCYHGKNVCAAKGPRKMSLGVLNKIFSDSRDLAESINFLYHGGEPMMAGLSFFKEVVALQQRFSFHGKITNSIQTNATLINDEWADFLVNNHFLVSTSIDGPAHIHDANRHSAGNKGSLSRVLKGVQLIKSRGARIGCIALLTKVNAQCPDEVYSALKESGSTGCAVHVCAKNDFDGPDLVPTTKEALGFMKRLFNLWLRDDDPSFQIRNFQNILRSYFGGRTLDCASGHSRCSHFIAIDSEGDVYPCHRFVGRKNFSLGNILEKPLATIFEQSQGVYDSMADIPKKCHGCRWFNVCGGGCAYERFVVNRTFHGLHPECALRQKLYPHMMQKLTQIELNL